MPLRHPFLLLLSLLAVAFGSPEPARAAEIAGSQTSGGVRPGATLLKVTNLDDEGPGSLRAALEEGTPRIIAFEVSGYIDLKKDVVVTKPFVTIAGQTAPSPGIVLRGGTLRIATHDVVVEHIAIYPGPGPDAKANQVRDAVVVGSSAAVTEVHDVVLRNVSLGWAVDEVFSTWRPTTRQVSLTSSIVAEALNKGHPKGGHSLSILIGEATRNVLVAGNLIAHALRRNPAIHRGASAFVANNLIYNPGQKAIHFYSPGSGSTAATIVGNVVVPGENTKRNAPLIEIPPDMAVEDPGARIFVADNGFADVSRSGGEARPVLLNKGETALAEHPPVDAPGWSLAPSSAVEAFVTRHAGSHPARRNPIDQRVVDETRSRRGRIIDVPGDVGGWPTLDQQRTALALPEGPLLAPAADGQPPRMAAWLCLRHFDVGGAAHAGCPMEASDYARILR